MDEAPTIAIDRTPQTHALLYPSVCLQQGLIMLTHCCRQADAKRRIGMDASHYDETIDSELRRLRPHLEILLGAASAAEAQHTTNPETR